MTPDELPVIATKTGFFRLRFTLEQDWCGTVQFVGDLDDPTGSLAVSIASDAEFGGVALDHRLEESGDGINWTPSSRPVTQVNLSDAKRGTAARTRRRRN